MLSVELALEVDDGCSGCKRASCGAVVVASSECVVTEGNWPAAAASEDEEGEDEGCVFSCPPLTRSKVVALSELTSSGEGEEEEEVERSDDGTRTAVLVSLASTRLDDTLSSDTMGAKVLDDDVIMGCGVEVGMGSTLPTLSSLAMVMSAIGESVVSCRTWVEAAISTATGLSLAGLLVGKVVDGRLGLEVVVALPK